MSQIVKLYPYQEKGKSMTYSAFRDSIDRVLLVLAMGLGKTTLCGEIIKDGYDKDKRILIVVHRDGLVRQFSDRIKKQFGVDNGLVLGSEKKEYRKPDYGFGKYDISLTRTTIGYVLEYRNNTRKATKILQKMLVATDPDILELLMQSYSQLKRKFLK